MHLSDKVTLALAQFSEKLRGKGHDDIADEIDVIAEDYAQKQKAPKKKRA